MKNSLKPALACATLFLFLMVTGCVEKNSKPCPECPGETAVDTAYSNGIIMPEKAHKLYVNYKDRRVDLIQDYEDAIDRNNKDPKQQFDKKSQSTESGNDDIANPGKFKVARYVSYEYEDLKKYMAYIEKEAELSGEKLTTLRFYFANYANEKKFEDGKPVKHPRQNTVMMSPTVKRDGGNHIFYIDDSKKGRERIVLLKDNFNDMHGKGDQMTPNSKNEASFLPNLFSAPKPYFAPKSTTKNEGHSSD
ncbi:hypothetical protein [Zobellia sp. 1_MG-2023]|uniref:hypothetical protein n=1 Tax=Zobellia sp. 1_MG-2023 TaxID=3062626 RepID=UPI0026E31B01|nr:hypothetical protein [Zobellia sp. 1_MG-2023]MDO6821218.1 hypothetical protein [Zobellia sp. 1_MG-2023]